MDVRNTMLGSEQVDKELDMESMTEICRYVTMGGTLVRFCVLANIKYSSMLEAIRSHPKYERMYIQACKDREDWLRDELLSLMTQITSFNIKDCYDENGALKSVADMPDSASLMIKKLTTSYPTRDKIETTVDNIEFYDKQKSIDQLGKYLSMFIDKTQHDVRLTLEETIARSYEKDKLGK